MLSIYDSSPPHSHCHSHAESHSDSSSISFWTFEAELNANPNRFAKVVYHHRPAVVPPFVAFSISQRLPPVHDATAHSMAVRHDNIHSVYSSTTDILPSTNDAVDQLQDAMPDPDALAFPLRSSLLFVAVAVVNDVVAVGGAVVVAVAVAVLESVVGMEFVVDIDYLQLHRSTARSIARAVVYHSDCSVMTDVVALSFSVV